MEPNRKWNLWLLWCSAGGRDEVCRCSSLICDSAPGFMTREARIRARPFSRGNSMSDLGSATPSVTRRAGKPKPSGNGKTNPSEDLLQALQAMRSGDFSVRMTAHHLGSD